MRGEAVGAQETRTLRRSADGILGGVASGLAEYVGVDPVVVRLVLAGLTVAGGSGVIAYGLLWACLPPPGSDRSPVEALLTRTAAAPGWVQGYLAIVVGLLVLDGVITDGGGLVVGLGLIGLGVVLFRRDTTVTTHASSTAPAAGRTASGDPAPAPAAPPAWPAPAAPTGRAAWPSAPPGSVPRRAWPPAAVPAVGGVGPAGAVQGRRGRSLLGRATLGLIVLALGAAAFADLAGLVQLDATRTLGVALSVVGMGLVIGTWWGRSRGLLALGLVMLTALTGLVLTGVIREAGLGARVERPVGRDQVRDHYELFAGLSVVDLSAVEFGRTPTAVTASVGVGRLVVIVPADVTVDIAGHVRAGDLEAPGEYAAGTEVRRSVRADGERDGGRLALDLGATIGSVVVRRADPEGALP